MGEFPESFFFLIFCGDAEARKIGAGLEEAANDSGGGPRHD